MKRLRNRILHLIVAPLLFASACTLAVLAAGIWPADGGKLFAFGIFGAFFVLGVVVFARTFKGDSSHD